MPIISLNDVTWRFRDCSEKSWLPANVPGCVHQDLRAAGKIPDPFWADNEAQLQWIEEKDWEYRATFSVTSAFLEEEVCELVADGLDTVATVTLNGVEIARTENMFIGFRWRVKPHLRRGKNEILIRFESAMKYIRGRRLHHAPRDINDPVGRCTVIRKEQCQFGWDWGPRFVTAGIWRDLRLEGWSGNRLESIRIQQVHTPDGAVKLLLAPELAHHDASAMCNWTLHLEGQAIAQGAGREIDVPSPELWWPHGQGKQTLYRLEIRVVSGERELGNWSRSIGLRTMVLDRHADEWGESFQFLVNGRAIFIKGANWIPVHTFVAGLTRADYERDLRSAVAVNMNMVRVWGGGIYEAEAFYDLCDELGLLVWQDYMFACTLYPADAEFVASVREEVAYQTKRLRHRACLALWCGNNEVFSCNAHELNDPAKKALYQEYEELFHRAIPSVHALHDPGTAYWPSSPWRGDTAADHAAGAKSGDTHYWDVWHSRFPVKDYERWDFRFVSEFGMQSYASPETQATFVAPGDDNVFGAAMENHQKNRGGNQVILDYVSRRYRFPKNQAALIYLSQLNQAYCMQVGVEHYRRLMPRCMGTMYWQINDCWPVASWSSIEYNGRWKALHYLARRFYAPSLVTAHVPGDESPSLNNYRRTTVKEVHLYTVHDNPQSAKGVMRWDLFHVDGRVLLRGTKKVALNYGESVLQKTLDLSRAMEAEGRDNLYLRIALEIGGKKVSEDSVLLTLPRFLNLTKGKTSVRIRSIDTKAYELSFRSDVFRHRYCFQIAGEGFSADDNYFDLFPGEEKVVRVLLEKKISVVALRKKLNGFSLAESY